MIWTEPDLRFSLFFGGFFWMKKVGRNGGRSIRDMGGDLAPLLSGLKLDAGIQVQGRLQRVNTFFFFWNRGNQRHSVSPRNLFLSNCRTKYLLSIGLSHSLTLFIYVYTPPSAFVSNFAVSCSGYLDIYLYTYLSIKYVYISLSPLSLLFSKIVKDAPLTRPGFSGSIFK